LAARWHGVGGIVGKGLNYYWVELGGNLLRAAPEQLRLASAEEVTALEKVPLELVDFKEQLRRKAQGIKGFEDIRSGSYPPGVFPPAPMPQAATVPMSSSPISGTTSSERASSSSSSWEVPIPPLENDTSVGVKRPASLEKIEDGKRHRVVGKQKQATGDRVREAVEQIESQLPSGPKIPMSADLDPMPEVMSSETLDEEDVLFVCDDCGEPEGRVVCGHRCSCGGEVLTKMSVEDWKYLKENLDEDVKSQDVEASASVFFCEETDAFVASSSFPKAGKEVYTKHMNEEDRNRFSEAITKEWETIISADAARVLSREESDRVRSRVAQNKDPRGPAIVASRLILTEKNEEDGRRAKARWCVAGYQEPSLVSQVENKETEGPTPSQDAKMAAYQATAPTPGTSRSGT